MGRWGARGAGPRAKKRFECRAPLLIGPPLSRLILGLLRPTTPRRRSKLGRVIDPSRSKIHVSRRILGLAFAILGLSVALLGLIFGILRLIFAGLRLVLAA